MSWKALGGGCCAGWGRVAAIQSAVPRQLLVCCPPKTNSQPQAARAADLQEESCHLSVASLRRQVQRRAAVCITIRNVAAAARGVLASAEASKGKGKSCSC